MQLVLLCKEEDFKLLGPEREATVFAPLLKDLKILENNGVFLGEAHGNRKGSVVFVLGDNLGSHMLGGFVESFSTVSHFCRYCLIPKTALDTGITSPRYYDMRNKKL